MRAKDKGTPQWLLKDAGDACVFPEPESASFSVSLVLVLPTLPVIATICAALRRRAQRPRSSSARSGSGTTSSAPADAISGVGRETTARAVPASSAAAANWWPSRRSPLIATKMSPGAIFRLSIDTPLIGRRGDPRSSPRVAAMTSSIVQSAVSATIGFSPYRGANGIVVAERNGGVADRLSQFVALAGDQQNVTLAEHFDRHPDRARPIAGIDATRTTGEDLGADFCRILAARIVIRHIGEIGEPRCNLAHLRPLSLVAIAACTEDHCEPVPDIGPQCGDG